MSAIQSVPGERQLTYRTLTVRVGPEHETCLVRLDGELDLDTVPVLDHELHRLLSARASEVILDLEGLEFIDSSGLHCLVRVSRHAQANGQNLEILAPGGDIERVIDVSGIGEVLPLVR